jgi:lipoprotein NlpD
MGPGRACRDCNPRFTGLSRVVNVGRANWLRIIPALAVVLFMVACSEALRWAPEYYEVRPGDTVYSIAWEYGIDQRDLIAWNGLDSRGLIHPGQRLRLSGTSQTATDTRRTSTGTSSGSSSADRTASRPPAKTVQPVSKWIWPTRGIVSAGFGASAKTQSGIHMKGGRGQPILAASAGEVVYSGSGLPGYGNLLIIKHNADYLSAYGYNDSLQVAEGQRVKSGQQIAKMGNGPGQKPLLHFEIRRQGQPVDPVRYLPAQ